MIRIIHFFCRFTVATLVAAGAVSAAIEPVAPGVYVYKDTTNVYAIVQNRRALLIDFGSGGILRELPALGVEKVDWILHTHFHREQCQGDPLARVKGIKIAVPELERKYFEAVEPMWQQARIFDLLEGLPIFHALRENLPVDRGLKPGDKFEWEGLRIDVFRSPGHTEGSLSYRLERDGKSLLFCGDAVGSPGKIPTFHNMEWGGASPRGGVQAEIKTLSLIRIQNPDLLLPSHGTPWRETPKTLVPLLTDMAALYDGFNAGYLALERPSGPLEPVTPHVWHGVGDTNFVIVADSGLAFVWDAARIYGEAAIEQIQKRTGFKRVDVMSVSHLHSDHTSGLEAVRKKYGGKIWAMEHMVDVLEHPMAYCLLFLWQEPVHVDRVLKDGEKVVWEGIPMQFVYLPGQTHYAQGLIVDVDGKRLMFTGDNLFPLVPGRRLQGHIRTHDWNRLDAGHPLSARKMLEARPDYLLPSHFETIPATTKRLVSYLDSSEAVRSAFIGALDGPDPMFGLDNNWLSMYPYQVEAQPGDTFEVEVRYRNYLARRSTIRAAFRGPEGWRFDPPVAEFAAAAKSEASARAKVTIAQTAAANRRYVLTVDTERDGERLGEVAEMLVNMLPMRAH
jgi:glyoxylase-like metal-dependent hydrolase (beta-lactamase superfamily II)